MKWRYYIRCNYVLGNPLKSIFHLCQLDENLFHHLFTKPPKPLKKPRKDSYGFLWIPILKLPILLPSAFSPSSPPRFEGQGHAAWKYATRLSPDMARRHNLEVILSKLKAHTKPPHLCHRVYRVYIYICTYIYISWYTMYVWYTCACS